MLRIGNDAYSRWTSAPALSSPAQIVSTIRHVDRSGAAAALAPASESAGDDTTRHEHHPSTSCVA